MQWGGRLSTRPSALTWSSFWHCVSCIISCLHRLSNVKQKVVYCIHGSPCFTFLSPERRWFPAAMIFPWVCDEHTCVWMNSCSRFLFQAQFVSPAVKIKLNCWQSKTKSTRKPLSQLLKLFIFIVSHSAFIQTERQCFLYVWKSLRNTDFLLCFCQT